MDGQVNPDSVASAERSRTLGEWVALFPQAARVFEGWAIDYCCNGKISLEQACEAKGMDADALRSELLDLVHGDPRAPERDWLEIPLSALMDHIVLTHNHFMPSEKHQLTSLAQKVARVHGERHPELYTLALTVDLLFAELESHLEHEEKEFFAACRKWENAPGVNGPDPRLLEIIGHLEEEHVGLGERLKSLKSLTVGFAPPADACNSYRVLYQGLERLNADLREHIHMENNILHVRLVAAAATAAAASRRGGIGADTGSGSKADGARPEPRPANRDKDGRTIPGSCCEG